MSNFFSCVEICADSKNSLCLSRASYAYKFAWKGTASVVEFIKNSY